MHGPFRFLTLPLILACLSALAIALLIYFLSGLIVFGGRVPYDYYRATDVRCNEWYRKEVFQDHRSPDQIAASPIRIPSCEDSVRYPRRTEILNTEEGLYVRLVIPETQEKPAIWLHVHGITDSYLNGMRFTDLATRQGFQLMLLELQNHGGSERHSQGSSWGCREKFDLVAALDFIHKTWPDKPILLSGTSMGTMTITQAALSKPERFKNVRGIIYESPLSSLDNISDRICSGFVNQGPCPFILKKLLPFFAKIRSDTDFDTCFAPNSPPTEIPTELWLSRQEFNNPRQIALASEMPAHKNLSIRIFAHGTHSAYYSYGPEEVEEALQSFWLKVTKGPVP